jgi:DNA-directed RNA polymerase subunit M/transcription elongation factor TFIIS
MTHRVLKSNNQTNVTKIQRQNNKVIKDKVIKDKVIKDKVIKDKVIKDKVIKDKVNINNVSYTMPETLKQKTQSNRKTKTINLLPVNTSSRLNSEDIGDIRTFNQKSEYLKMFTFSTLAANNININILHYVITNLNRTLSVMALSKYVPMDIADKIENGIIEKTMLELTNEKDDVIEFISYHYDERLRNICANLDIHNKRINNQTLVPSLINGTLDGAFIPFLKPEQIHPVRWMKELEKRRIEEEANNNTKVTDMYKCHKCGDRKCTTVQMQTRSADEPMTIFVTCLTCKNTFKTQ